MPKIVFRTSMVYYHLDCPLDGAGGFFWYHPDAVQGRCIRRSNWTTHGVRTELGVAQGTLPPLHFARHLHNFDMTDAELAHKYRHYSHACYNTHEVQCQEDSYFELRWRSCDSTAPQLSKQDWTFDRPPKRPWGLNLIEMHDGQRSRRPREIAELARSPLALPLARPARYEHWWWPAYRDANVPPDMTAAQHVDALSVNAKASAPTPRPYVRSAASMLWRSAPKTAAAMTWRSP